MKCEIGKCNNDANYTHYNYGRIKGMRFSYCNTCYKIILRRSWEL